MAQYSFRNEKTIRTALILSFYLVGRQAAVIVDRGRLENVTRWSDHLVLASSVHVAASMSLTAVTDMLIIHVNAAMSAIVNRHSSMSVAVTAAENVIRMNVAAVISPIVAASRPTLDVTNRTVTAANVNTRPAAVVAIRTTAFYSSTVGNVQLLFNAHESFICCDMNCYLYICCELLFIIILYLICVQSISVYCCQLLHC